jgi:hypothetical protein
LRLGWAPMLRNRAAPIFRNESFGRRIKGPYIMGSLKKKVLKASLVQKARQSQKKLAEIDKGFMKICTTC